MGSKRTGAGRTSRLAAALLATVLALGACGGDEGRDDAAVANGAAEGAMPTASAAGAAGAPEAFTGGDGAAAVVAADEQRAQAVPADLGADRVVKTASLEVEVGDGGFAAAFSRVPGIAAAHGGFVASSTSTHGRLDGEHAAGSIVVRVPAERFDAAREELADLGRLRSQQLRGEDVGAKLTDLDARLRNLRSHEEALRLLMTKTGTIGETIEVQRQLMAVREQIEQLAGEQARLADAVAYSTLTLSLAEPGATIGSRPDRSPLTDALARAVEGAERVLAGLIVAVGYLVPLALLVGVGWVISRSILARRRVPQPVLDH